MVQLAYKIDIRVRNMRRYRLLTRLKDVPVHIYGHVGPKASRLVPNGIFHAPVPFSAMLDLFDNSRVVLNDTINLRDSALIRLFYSMARGCVVATEMNRFVANAFTPLGEIIPMSGDAEEGMALLRQCVEAPDSCQEMAEAALATYQAGHTWSHRIDGLVKAIEAS